MFSVVATAPVLTLFAVALLTPSVKDADNERFLSAFGSVSWGKSVEIAIVVTASTLLLFASNTAIIGFYHVFLALTDRGFMPSVLALRNRYFETPHIAIIVATMVPNLVIMFVHGNLTMLANLHAFGLLGCFVLSSADVQVLRWRSRVRGWRFWIGIFTTLLVLLAWSVNLVVKGEATLFGPVIVGAGLVIALGTRRKWFADWFYRIPTFARLVPRRISQTEDQLEHAGRREIFSLAQTESIAQLYPPSTMIAVRSVTPGIVNEALAREKGRGGKTLYALHVEERTGLFVGNSSWKPKDDGLDALRAAVQAAESEGMMVIPVWTVSYNAVEGISRTAEMLGVTAIMIGVTQRSSIYHLLRGHVLAGLTKRLHPGIRLLSYG